MMYKIGIGVGCVLLVVGLITGDWMPVAIGAVAVGGSLFFQKFGG